jgi:hypothetical protein
LILSDNIANDPVNWVDPWGLELSWYNAGISGAQIIGGVGTMAAGVSYSAGSAGVGAALGGAAVAAYAAGQVADGIADILAMYAGWDEKVDTSPGFLETFSSPVGSEPLTKAANPVLTQQS